MQTHNERLNENCAKKNKNKTAEQAGMQKDK